MNQKLTIIYSAEQGFIIQQKNKKNVYSKTQEACIKSELLLAISLYNLTWEI